MANTIAGVNLAKVAQETLPALTDMFAPLAALATDFSSNILTSGESVTTRIPSEVTAGDMSVGYETAASDVSTVAVTVNVDQHKGFSYGFTDVERSLSEVRLEDLFIQPALEAVGEDVFGYIWNLITAASFTNSTVIASSSFDRDSLVDLRTALNNQKAMRSNRAVICNPTYYGSLTKTLNSAEIPGMNQNKTEGTFPRAADFTVYETTLADNNSENLAAFAFHKSALCMVARSVLVDEATLKNVEVETVVIPGLGLPVQFRRWYNPEGKLYLNMNLLYGASVGVTTAGHRVTTA